MSRNISKLIDGKDLPLARCIYHSAITNGEDWKDDDIKLILQFIKSRRRVFSLYKIIKDNYKVKFNDPDRVHFVLGILADYYEKCTID